MLEAVELEQTSGREVRLTKFSLKSRGVVLFFALLNSLLIIMHQIAAEKKG